MELMVWIVVAVVFAVAEIFTTTLFLLMFAAGAVAAAGAAGLGAPVPAQAGVFVVVSALTLAGVRPALHRRLSRSAGPSFGMERMRGASAVVVEQVDAGHGMVRVDGELWQARALEGMGTSVPGERVRIVDVSDGTALVWPAALPGGAADPTLD
ncbi:NfeD family protein [Actinoplanes sp. N902-109]|uniref:NfeD family protein n=1 Tax=Actinoplanes sp. (strain N902-109) TaxID=649831 RepID=UPI0003296787|nr:NfeD family protein [Actinoplanes sp. N902-109]AGL16278.1 Putative activity regulator of membrane protease YbbK [Actinoplanes sp. N902-109]